MRLQERVRRAQKRTQDLREQAQVAYLWDRYQETDGEDSMVLVKFLSLWVNGKPPHDDLQAAYPVEEYPNLYLWLSAVFNMRADLAPARPITEPLSDEEIERRVSLLPASQCPRPKRGRGAA